MSGLTIALLVGGALGTLLLFGRSAKDRELAAKRTGAYASDFVMVEDDATAGELTSDERVHLNGECAFGDGARPYIKPSYHSLTPDNRIGGYLLRRKLPRKIVVRANDA